MAIPFVKSTVNHSIVYFLWNCQVSSKNSQQFAERPKTNSTSEGISYIVYIIGISEGKKGCVQCFSVNSALNKKTSFFA